MRPARALLAATAAAFGLTVATATPASAAPPVGCYGLPDYPAAFFCVTTFTPENAAGEPSSVTVPTVCAGECYGPFTVPVPAGGGGGGAIATIVYGGETYVVVVGEVPDVPPVGAPTGDCPGEYPVIGTETEPYACLHHGSDPWVWYVGTCVTGSCETTRVAVPLVNTDRIVQNVEDAAMDAAATVADALRCESLNICMD